MEYISSVILFAVASSITPGPNNIMIMSSGLNFGIRKSLPLLTGISLGFTIMLLLVGLGFGQLFSIFPQLALIIKIVGTVYLLYLSWLLMKSTNMESANHQNKKLGFLNGILFQWINAKSWVVAIGAISAFTSVGEHYLAQNLTIASSFFFISFPCIGFWLLCGSSLRHYLDKPKYFRWFNISMSLLLITSTLPVINDIWQSF